jgi:hypothetical protein
MHVVRLLNPASSSGVCRNGVASQLPSEIKELDLTPTFKEKLMRHIKNETFKALDPELEVANNR